MKLQFTKIHKSLSFFFFFRPTVLHDHTFCVHEPGWDFTYELPYSSRFSTLATHFKPIFRLAVIQLDAGPKNKKQALIFKRLTHNTDRSIFEFNLLLNGNALNIYQFQILKARNFKEPAS